jgi:hypothetical protein
MRFLITLFLLLLGLSSCIHQTSCKITISTESSESTERVERIVQGLGYCNYQIGPETADMDAEKSKFSTGYVLCQEPRIGIKLVITQEPSKDSIAIYFIEANGLFSTKALEKRDELVKNLGQEFGQDNVHINYFNTSPSAHP